MSVLINEKLHSHRLKWRWPLSRQVTLSIGTLAVLLTVWWAVAALQLISPLFLPPPQQVLAKLLTIAGPQGFMDATLWQHLAASLTRILLALLAAVLIGIPVGIAMGLSPTVRGILDPIIELYRPVPPLAYLPLMVIWFGIGETSKILLIYLAIFAPVAMSALAGVKSAQQVRIRAAQSLGASRAQVLWFVILPGALPEILTGLRIGLGVGWSTLVAAELIAATRGLGFMVQSAGEFLATDVVLAGIAVIAIIAFLLELGLRALQRRLTRPLSDNQFEQLYHAVLRHQVVFLRDQAITPQQQRALAQRFGELHIHPVYPHAEGVDEIIVLDTHNDNPPDNDNWHTDVTFIETPPAGAILAAKELPSTGGDTLWTSGIAAYEALSVPFRQLLSGLRAEHDFRKSFPEYKYRKTEEEHQRWREAVAKNPPLLHPVVRTHPVSGKQALFVNEGFTTRIVDVSEKESEALLSFLFAHITKPEFQVRWRWQPNDIAIWDNRVTQHYANADYLPQRRIMHRATILGDIPFYRAG